MEGITNSIFQREDVEAIAAERLAICKKCPSKLYDETGEGCLIVGTAPCCHIEKGGCGCSLAFKTRSLSSACDKGHWLEELSQSEDDLLKQKLGL